MALGDGTTSTSTTSATIITIDSIITAAVIIMVLIEVISTKSCKYKRKMSWRGNTFGVGRLALFCQVSQTKLASCPRGCFLLLSVGGQKVARKRGSRVEVVSQSVTEKEQEEEEETKSRERKAQRAVLVSHVVQAVAESEAFAVCLKFLELLELD